GAGRGERLRGNALRILTEGHVPDVHQPSVRERILRGSRGPGEQLSIELYRTLGTPPDPMHTLAPDGEDAGVRGVVLGAVLRLSAPEMGEGEVGLDRLGRIRRHDCAQLLLKPLQGGDGRLHVTVIERLRGDLPLGGEAFLGIVLRGEQPSEIGDLLLVLVPLVVPYALALCE